MYAGGRCQNRDLAAAGAGVFIVLELLFGTIQALVFALLTAIYITMAAGDSHGGERAQHAPDEDHEPEPSTAAHAPAAAGE